MRSFHLCHVVCLPQGPDGAQQVRNDTVAPARVLRIADVADYWDGEG